MAEVPVFDPRGALQVELHRLELRFADTRVREPRAIDALTRSIERCGQLVACIAVEESRELDALSEAVTSAAGAPAAGLLLLDGYRRVQALHRLGCDLARVEIWGCTVEQGLLAVLTGSQARAYAPIEQALLLRELQGRGLSQHQLARGCGRDVSWVSRRLGLIAQLPESLLASVREGTLSSWAASRVFSPLARANSAHAEALLAAVREEGLSTRELRLWWEHYQSAARRTRERMVQHPRLFLQARLAQAEQQELEGLRAGPEGRCLEELQRLRWWLKRLRERLRGLSTQGLVPELAEAVRCIGTELEAWRRELEAVPAAPIGLTQGAGAQVCRA
jgi:ParB family chromosome partitioning protein